MGRNMSDTLLVVSIHIPKTAGSTLLRILVDQYGEGLQRAYQPPRAGVSPADSDGWPTVADPLCIHGHDIDRFLPLIRAIPREQVCWITFLRDPLAGAVSLWHYTGRYRGWDGRRAEAGTDLHAYLRTGYNHDRYGKWLSRLGIAEADLAFTGIVEQFDRSIDRLRERLGWPGVGPYESRNVGGYAVPTLPASLVDEFHAANANDYAMYERAVERLATSQA